MITTTAQVDLCNQALRALGEKPIALPADPTNPRWLLAQQFYDQVQDTLLTEHAWAFAIERVSLDTTATTEPWGWQFEAALPADYLAAQRTAGSAAFQREGARLLTNEDPLQLTYTARIIDVTRWPPSFTSAFVAALTAAFAEQITGQLDKHKIWYEIAGARLKRAIEINDREGSPIPVQGTFASGVGLDLVNQALRPLGELPVQSRFLLSDAYFAQLYERLLVSHAWAFATVRVVLTPEAGGAAAWGYLYRYALPTDYLAMQRTEDSQVYQREGALLLSNETPLRLTYTRTMPDPALWPRAFAAAFVAACTAELAAQQPEERKNLEAWLKIADEQLKRAILLDGRESAPIQAQSLFSTGAGLDLVNQALRPLGDLPMPSRFLLSDQFFAQIWERLLTEHFWNFATARVVLTAAPGVTPAWGYAHAFAVPDDYLSIQRVQIGLVYQREGDYFVSDEPTLPLTYTRRITDVTAWPAYFRAAFVAQLTVECAAQFPQYHQSLPGWLTLAAAQLKRAKTQDGQEGSPPRLQSPDLILARFGGWRR